MTNTKENRKLWVEALRSGKYTQGRGQLEDKDGNLCCLGVAVKVYQEVSGSDDKHLQLSGGSLGDYPKVKEWVGLENYWGFYHTSDTYSLVRKNDNSRLDFNQIADIIESEPEGLFDD